MIVEVSLAIFIYMNIFFLLALWKKNYSVIDIGWGPGFIMISIINSLHHSLNLKSVLILITIILWGLRLGIYLFSRNINKEEDFRYAQLRQEWGATANLQAYLKVFMLQGFLMFIISLPISIGLSKNPDQLYFFNWIGLALWCTGWILEVTSDHYLTWFKSKEKNRGKICTSGPWRLCRFPNYFGEILLWYGIYLLCLRPDSWWTILGPITINLFILKVSGIPLLEKKYNERAEYQSYSKKIPKLIPFTKP